MEQRVEKHLTPLLRSKFNLVGYVKIDPEFHPQWIRQETRSRREKGLFPYPDALFQLLGDAGMWKRTLDSRGRQYYQPRPVVAAYATVARILAGAVDPLELRPRDGFHGYLFSRKDHTVVALWTTAGEPRRVRIAMPADCELWDLMGNARALPAGEVELTVGQSPAFLVSPGDRKAIAAAIQQASFPDA
jgi:hypothetical protein